MENKPIAEHQYSVCYGNTEIQFSLSFSNRTTLAIHVYPNQAVVVEAPYHTAWDRIESKMIKRACWIRTQQKKFEKFPPVIPVRKYVSGETFRYLGRQYRLKIERNMLNKVVLQRGRLFVYVSRNTSERVKELVDAWYKERASQIFQERLKICLMHVMKAKIHYHDKLQLREMKVRWGSCTKEGKIILNPKLVEASKDCIDYVITHELCHLREYNHSKTFYEILSYVMPDWQARRDKLNGTVEFMESTYSKPFTC